MSSSNEKVLEENGWIIECESPFEIRHKESGSFASNQAAYMILNELNLQKSEAELKQLKREKLREQFFKETNIAPVFANRTPYIQYIEYLEDKVIVL